MSGLDSFGHHHLTESSLCLYLMQQIIPFSWMMLEHPEPRKLYSTFSDSSFTGVSYMWNICGCNVGILWNIYGCSSGILLRVTLIPWRMCSCTESSMLLLSVYFSICYFLLIVSWRRFPGVCTSLYHALSCDYREFHAYNAACGCSDSRSFHCWCRATVSMVRSLQNTQTFPTLLQRGQRVKPAAEVLLELSFCGKEVSISFQ